MGESLCYKHNFDTIFCENKLPDYQSIDNIGNVCQPTNCAPQFIHLPALLLKMVGNEKWGKRDTNIIRT